VHNRFDFTKGLIEYGNTPEGMGVSHKCQMIRFGVFKGIIKEILPEPTSFSLMDLGCGYGAIVSYLQENLPGYTISKYVGLDVIPLALMRAKHYLGSILPEGSVELCLVDSVDLFEPAYSEKTTCDFVFSSGVLQNLAPDVLYDFIEKSYRMCNKASVVNTRSMYQDWAEPHLNSYDPCLLFRIAMNHTKYVKLEHTYLSHDFSLVMMRK
jgi:SAM-dependent methyltransferase